MRRMRHVDPECKYIDYHLNLLGIRVTAHDCQLVARREGHWETIGPSWPLPIEVPEHRESAVTAAISLTAWQYDKECPGSDIRDVLSQRKSFRLATQDRSAF